MRGSVGVNNMYKVRATEMSTHFLICPIKAKIKKRLLLKPGEAGNTA